MPFWSWTGTATQAAVGGGVVDIDVTAGVGNVVRILYAQAVGVFAAADSLDLFTNDEDGNVIANLGSIALGGAGTARATHPRATTNIDSTTSSGHVTGMTPVELAGPDFKLTVLTTALAQNDTAQLLLWAWVKNLPGTISVARSTGTVAAITPTVNEVY